MSAPRIGIIGVGRFGQNHARICGELPGVELVGIYDIDAARGGEIASRCHTVSFPRLEALLDAVEMVCVVTPTATHREVAMHCIRRGLPTFVEKPVCALPHEAEELLEAAEKHSARIAVGHLERFNAAARAMLQRFDGFSFFHAERHGPWVGRQVTVDVVADLMIHDIDLLQMLDASPVVEIRSSGRYVVSPYLDVVSTRLRLASGAVAVLEANRVSHAKFRTIELHSGDDLCAVDMMAQQFLSGRGITAEPVNTVVWEGLELTPTEPLREELLAFIAGGPSADSPLAGGADGLRALELAARIVAAVGDGR